MHSLRRGSLALLLAACAPHEPDPAVEPPPRLGLAARLAIDLPGDAGREPIGDGPALWLGVDSLTVVEPGGAVKDLGAPRIDDNAMVVGLYEALAPLPRAAGLDLFVDRRVPTRTLALVLHTAARSEWPVLRLLGGSPARPGALSIEPGAFTSSHPPARPPFGELAADLLLEWGEHGVLAAAQVRPADRLPFAIDWYTGANELGDGAPPELPQRVPLRLGDGAGPQDALDRGGVARLAAAVCARNGGPTGVSLRPLPTTPYAELLAIAVAAELDPKCTSRRRLEPIDDPPPPAASGVAVADLETHVLARVAAQL